MHNGCYVICTEKATLDALYADKEREFRLAYGKGYVPMHASVRRIDETRMAVFSLNDGCAEAVCAEIKRQYPDSEVSIVKRGWKPFVTPEHDGIITIENLAERDDYRYFFTLSSNNSVFVDVFVDGSIRFGFLDDEKLIDEIVEHAILVLESPERSA